MPLGLIICFGSMNRWAPLGAIGRRKLALSQRVARMLDEGGELVLDGQQLTEDKARALVKSSARWSKVLLEFRPVSLLCRFVVWVIRGTPLMLQLYIIFYIPGYIFPNNPWSFPEGRFAAASVMFIVNYACYFSEIYRGGIQGVPIGQQEAGQVLGMTKGQIFFKVTLLQMIKRIVPPMSNEIITLVKDTSLARIISYQEVIWAGFAFLKGSHGYSGLLWPLFFTGVYYLVFNGVVSFLLGRLEKKLEFFR
ncbi:MAG TPA: amino acid ABC transporter permease [Candidatus Scatomorpha gallistercoris]|nr:amino acid ABC transporter permease [Candidatus Scatomorpha gallistercoris]